MIPVGLEPNISGLKARRTSLLFDGTIILMTDVGLEPNIRRLRVSYPDQLDESAILYNSFVPPVRVELTNHGS